MKTESAGMDGIVSTIDKPCGEGRRQRHIDQKLHFAGVGGCSAIVSSSARNAA